MALLHLEGFILDYLNPPCLDRVKNSVHVPSVFIGNLLPGEHGSGKLDMLLPANFAVVQYPLDELMNGKGWFI
jgi:hypothetical protein